MLPAQAPPEARRSRRRPRPGPRPAASPAGTAPSPAAPAVTVAVTAGDAPTTTAHARRLVPDGPAEGEDAGGPAPGPAAAAYEGAFGFSETQITFAPTVLGCMRRENPVRAACIAICKTRAFELVVMGLILVSSVLLGCWQPVDNVLGITSELNNFIARSEWFFQAAFSLEFVIKILALGVSSRPSGYFREPWNLLDAGVLVAGWIPLLTHADTSSTFMVLRLARVLRPLRTLKKYPALQSLVQAMLNAGRQLAEVLLFSSAILLIFALVGVTLFKGKLRQHCATFDEAVGAFIVPTPEVEMYCSMRPDRYGRACPPGLTCVVTDFNPHLGLQGFDNIGLSLFTVFQIITLEGWSDVMYGLFDTSPRVYGVYFILLILFGAYFMVNLVVAALSVHYMRVRKRDEARKLVMLRANTEIKTMVSELERKGAAARSFASRPFSEQLAITEMRLAFSYEQNAEDPLYELVPERFYLDVRARYGSDYTDVWRPHFRRALERLRRRNAAMLLNARFMDRLNAPRLQFVDAHSSLASVYRMDEALPRVPDPVLASETASPATESAEPLRRQATVPRVETPSSSLSRMPQQAQEDERRLHKSGAHNTSFESGFSSDAGCGSKGCSAWIAEHVTSKAWFNNLTMLLIGCNALVLATEHFGQSERLTTAQNICNDIFLALFSLEVLLRIAAAGARKYFGSAFNCFDCIVVLVGYVELAFPSVPSLSALRVLRFLRILNPKTRLSGFHEILTSVNRTVAHIAPFMFFLMILLYTFAVAGLHLFGGQMAIERETPVRVYAYPGNVTEPEDNLVWAPNPNFDCTQQAGSFYRELDNGTFVWHCPPRVNYDNLLWAFVTTFQVITGEDWNGAMFEVVERTGSTLPVIYFVLAVVLGSFLVLNLFLAILLDTFVQNHTELRDGQDAPQDHAESFASSPRSGDSASLRTVPSGRALYLGEHEHDDLELGVSDQGGRGGAMAESVPPASRRQLLAAMGESGSSSSTAIRSDGGSSGDGESPAEDGPDRVPQPRRGLGGKCRSLNDVLERRARKRYNLTAREVVKLPAFRHPALCGLVPGDHPWRIAAGILVHRSWFDSFIILVIVWSCVLLALDSPVDVVVDSSAMFAMNVVITSLFAVEALLRIFALGFVRHQGSYLRSAWNVLDFAILVVSVLDVCLPQSSATEAVKVIRVARVLRPLRVIQKFEGLRIIVQSFAKAAVPCVQVVVLCLYFFAIFSISATAAFHGRLYACYECPLGAGNVSDAPVAQGAATCVRNFAPSAPDCFRYPDYGIDEAACPAERLCAGVDKTAGVEYLWSSPTYGDLHSTSALATPYSFDSFGSSLLVLFETSTLEVWMEPMYALTDATSIGFGAVRGSNDGASIFYIVFLFTMQCFVLQIFVAVLINAYLDSTDQVTGDAFMTDDQRAWVEFHQRALTRAFKSASEALRPRGALRSRVYDLVMDRRFDFAINTIIVANTVWLMTEHLDATPAFEETFAIVEAIFGAVYVFEAACKILAMGPRQYFRAKTNCFDFTIVVVVVVNWALQWSGARVDVTILRAVEALRVLRVVRLLKLFRPLKVLVSTLLMTLFPVLNVTCLIGLIFFVYSVLGMSLFGGQIDLNMDARSYFSEAINFDTFGNAFYTLFVLSTGEDWNGYLRELQVAVPAHAGWFVVSFVLLTQIILMNLFVAVIMTNYTTQFERNQDPGSLKDHLDEHSFSNYNRVWNDIYNARIVKLRAAVAREARGPAACGSCARAHEDDGRAQSFGPAIGPDRVVGPSEARKELELALASPLRLPAQAFTKLVFTLEAPLGLRNMSKHKDLGFTPAHVMRLVQGHHIPIDSNGQIEFYKTLTALIDINMLVDDVPATVRAFLQQRVGADHVAFSGSFRHLPLGAAAEENRGLRSPQDSGTPPDPQVSLGGAADPSVLHFVAREHIKLLIRRYVLRWRLRKAHAVGASDAQRSAVVAQLVSTLRGGDAALTVA